MKIIENIQNLSVGLCCPRYQLYISVYTRASCVMLGSIAAAGAWIRKFKENYVELQSLREKKVHQDLMEVEARLERLSKQIPQKIQLEAMQSTMKKLATENKQLNEHLDRMIELLKNLKDPMNEQERENIMEKLITNASLSNIMLSNTLNLKP
ncbi:hypothetical protein ACE6H2_001513 [Prunus campanulata]